jgi:hypothetical protein
MFFVQIKIYTLEYLNINFGQKEITEYGLDISLFGDPNPFTD